MDVFLSWVGPGDTGARAEAFTAARQLAGPGGHVVVGVGGAGARAWADRAQELGAHRVCIAVGAGLPGGGAAGGDGAGGLAGGGEAGGGGVPEEMAALAHLPAWVEAALQLWRFSRAPVAVFSGGRLDADVAPRFAHRARIGLVTDCIGMEPGHGGTAFLKPVYGGKAVAKFRIKGGGAALCLRPGAFEAAQAGAAPGGRPARDAGEAGAVEEVAVHLDPAAAPPRFVRWEPEPAAGARLEEAPIVLAGGRGIGSAGGFQRLTGLAARLGAAVGASSVPVNEGWAPPALKVGQTGKTVRPDVYVAVGISGASQHVAGISGAKTVVAINKDPEAPIFRAAHLGAVGDWQAILPPFVEELAKLLGRE